MYDLPPILLSTARIPALALGLPLVAGFLSGKVTPKAVKGRWFKSMYQPPGYPPAIAFPVCWTGLYLSMGYASHLAVRALDQGALSLRDRAALGLGLYYGQLVLNLVWSPLFFGLKEPGIALAEILMLTSTTIHMTRVLHDATDGATTWFLVPYCAWLGYATYLNAGLWWLNRGRSIPKTD